MKKASVFMILGLCLLLAACGVQQGTIAEQSAAQPQAEAATATPAMLDGASAEQVDVRLVVNGTVHPFNGFALDGGYFFQQKDLSTALGDAKVEGAKSFQRDGADYYALADILSPGGKEKWQHGTIVSILTNEKYKGDAILQKTFCADFLTKKIKRNEGELPQYYVSGSHPAIIPAEVFDEVQLEMKRRREANYSAREHCFSGRIICGDCGASYIEKVWHSTSQYKRRIWQCSRKFKNDDRCRTPHLYEDDVKAAFIRAMNGMIEDKDDLISEYRQIILRLTDHAALDFEAKLQTEEVDVLTELIRKCVAENATTSQHQEVYAKRYKGLKARYEAATQRLKQIEDQRTERKQRRQKMLEFIRMLENSDGLLIEFDEGLWNATVEKVTVMVDGSMVFKWRNGTELTTRI